MALPSPSPTAGFKLNHFGLRVANIDRSVAFYTNALGLDEIGRIPLETATIVFLAYVDHTEPRPDFASIFRREGVLELVSSLASDPIDNETVPSNSKVRRVKLAISVPNVAKVLAATRQHGAKVVKDVDEYAGSAEVAKFLGCKVPEEGFDPEFWKMALPVPFVEDPDGNLIEILQDTSQA